MIRLFTLTALIAASANALAGRVWIEVVPIERGFTSTLTPDPTDIWAYVVSRNRNTGPVFSLDLSIPGVDISFGSEFVHSPGAPIVQNTSGPLLVAGILPAADTYFSVPESIDPSNIAVAPGTTVETARRLSAAYTITGDTPILAAGETGVTLVTLALPAGTAPPVPFEIGSAAVRTANGLVLVPVGIFPEPGTSVLLAATGVLAAASIRRS